MLSSTLLVWVVCAQAVPALPDNVVAIVDGKEITLDAYKDYLWRLVGRDRVQHFVDEILITKKAAELGVVVSDADVAVRVEEEVQRRIEGFYQGSVAKWRAQLAERGRTLEEFKAQLAQQLRSDLVLEQCVRATRTVDDARILERFERDFGNGGVVHDLRHILVNKAPKGAREPDRESEASARDKAERILRELRDDADFGEMAGLYSDDTYTKNRGGQMPRYRAGVYGEEFDAAVEALSEGNRLSGIVSSPRGFHIVELVGRRVTRLEDVKEEIRATLLEEAPSAKDKYDFVQGLRAAARITL